MLQWIQILDYADSYAYFVDYDAEGSIALILFKILYLGSKIISFFAVWEGLVPWDWLFLEKVKSIRNLGVASSISRGCWFGRDGSRLSWMKRFINRPSLGKMEVIDFPAIWSSNFWKMSLVKWCLSEDWWKKCISDRTEEDSDSPTWLITGSVPSQHSSHWLSTYTFLSDNLRFPVRIRHRQLFKWKWE